MPLVRHAGAVFCGPWAPASAGRLPGRAVARAAHQRLGPLRPGPHGGRLHQARPRRDGHRSAALRRRCRRRGRRWPKPRGCPPTPTASAGGRESMEPVPVRDDLRALEGYHSPQVSVPVRLNTNESPEPPPAAWRDAFAAELSRIEWHRYPDRGGDRAAGRHRLAARRPARPGVRRQRLERGAADPAARLRRPRPHGGHLRADVPAARPHRPHHRYGGGGGRAGAPTSRSTWPRCAGCWRRPGPIVTFLCSPNNPTGMVEPEAVVREVLDQAPGLVVVDEAYGQFAPWSALDLVDDDRPLVVTRTFSKTWSMAASPARLPRRAVVARGRAGQGGAAVPPRRRQADRRAARAALRRRDGGPGEGGGGRARAPRRRRWPTLPVHVVAVGGQLRPVPARGARRPRRVDGACSSGTSSCATARRGRASTAACGSPSARREEDDAFLAALAEVLGVSASARRSATGPPRRPTSPSRIDLDGTGQHRRSAPACRSTTTCSTSSAATVASTSPSRPPATSTSTATTPWRTPPSCSGEAFREALGDKAGVRRFASGLYPLDEALVDVALDLSGRPFVVWEVDAARGDPARLAAVRPQPGRARHRQLRHRRRHHPPRHARAGVATCTTSSRRRSRAWPGACRRIRLFQFSNIAPKRKGSDDLPVISPLSNKKYLMNADIAGWV